MTQQFKVGDLVEWDARATGSRTTTPLKAHVVCIVPTGRRVPGLYLPNLGSAGHCMRQGISYIVRTERGRIYWPVTCMLRAAEKEPE